MPWSSHIARAIGALVVPALLADSAVVQADGVAEEVTVGTSVAEPGSAATQWIADRIAGTWTPNERWEIGIDVAATRARSTTISSNASDAVVTSLSVDYEVNDHWSLHTSAGWSPRVVKSSLSRIEADGLPDDMVEADVVLLASAWTTALGASATYDTAGDSDFETTVSVSARASYYSSEQAIASMRAPGGGQMYTPDELIDYCVAYPDDCSDELFDGLFPQRTQVRQLVLGASFGHTIYEDTDVGFDLEHYYYDQDPTQAGYFAIATVDGGSLGEGVAVAPMLYAVSPTISHRFGIASATATAAYGGYIAGQGHDVSASLKAQVKLRLGDDRKLKLYGKFASSWFVPPDARPSQSVSLAVGGEYLW